MKRFRIAVLGAWALTAAAATPLHAHPGRPAAKAPSPQASTSSTRKKPKKKHATKRQPSQQAPTPDRISEIQSALARGGYYQGDPNGKWDANTVAAVEKFQSAHGIDSSGKLDAPTLQKLGLGSDIAGVSAPRPVTPSPAPATAQPQSSNQPSGPSSTSSSSTISGTVSRPSTGATNPGASGSQFQRP